MHAPGFFCFIEFTMRAAAGAVTACLYKKHVRNKNTNSVRLNNHQLAYIIVYADAHTTHQHSRIAIGSENRCVFTLGVHIQHVV